MLGGYEKLYGGEGGNLARALKIPENQGFKTAAVAMCVPMLCTIDLWDNGENVNI
jgi:hypothetical protein